MDNQTIFERPFDFDKYIEDRLLAIENLDERAFARKHLADSLRLIMRESEEAYRRLEERVFAEVPATGDKHHIYITVIERDTFDITNGAWLPLIDGDEQTQITTKEVPPFAIDCLFYSGHGEARKDIVTDELTDGKVTTKSGEYDAVFKLTPSSKYMEKIEFIYGLFHENGLPWTTQNCGYLLRFFDVILVEAKTPKDEEITEYNVDFNMPHLERNRFPVWNVQQIFYDSEQFVVPIIDTKYFEHTFPIEAFGAEHGYLIEGNQDIFSFRQTRDKICVVTVEETFRKWVAYKIVNTPPKTLHCFNFPILNNSSKGSFVERYSAQSKVLLQSKLEVFRQIAQYDLLDILKFQDVELLIETEEYDSTYLSRMNVSSRESASDTYLSLDNLNWFIADDLVNRREQKVLLFRFYAAAVHFLHHDLISFIISQLQRQFNEYRCEAVLDVGGSI